jgi:hypothetical protein
VTGPSYLVSFIMDAFLDSVEPDFSDSECEPSLDTQYVKLQSIAPKRSVRNLFISAKPESLIIDCILSQLSVEVFRITHAKDTCGSIAYVGDDAFVILDSPLFRFSVSDIVESYDHLVLLGSQIYRKDVCAILSTVPDLRSSPRDFVVDGLQAFLLTEAIKIGAKGSVIMNLHSSIRVEFDSLWALWEKLHECFLQDLPKLEPVGFAQTFRRACPINTKVPLYS